MQDDEILKQITAMVSEEHGLRERLAAGELTTEEEHARVSELDVALDRCWDLLRRRRARRDAGEDPDNAAPLPVSEVEAYEQ